MVQIGKYKIIKELALDERGEPTGGCGRIYQARHVELGELACLKQNKTPHSDLVGILRHEAKLLWKLEDHHSIPSVKDFFHVKDNYHVMVMSYIEGDTIGQTVAQNSRLHSRDVCWITERLLGAVYYAHYNGVIHSDIKPENVFVEPKKRDIKLIDFGLASYRPTAASAPLGHTPLYAAPELKRGDPPIPETDLYGVGMVMLYALGGDVMSKRLPSDVPGPVAEFCSRLLRYNPLDRPNWKKENLIQTISDIRHEVFGKRHPGEKLVDASPLVK